TAQPYRMMPSDIFHHLTDTAAAPKYRLCPNCAPAQPYRRDAHASGRLLQVSSASRSRGCLPTGEASKGGYPNAAIGRGQSWHEGSVLAVVAGLSVTAAPIKAQAPERPIGDIQVFATLPYPGHPGGLA